MSMEVTLNVELSEATIVEGAPVYTAEMIGAVPLNSSTGKIDSLYLPDQASLDAEVDSKIDIHNADKTSVHGISNTENLVYTSDSRLSDARIPIAHSHAISDVTNLQSALDEKQASGTYATLVSGKVPSDQLPSFVDDVLEYANNSAFPATGEAGKIYVSLATNKTFRWSGSAYIEISPSEVTSINTKTGAVTLTASDVGACASNDARLSDKRTPTAHKSSHATGGADALAPSDIGAQPAGSYELTSSKNAANGYAGLGADGKIALSQLPDANALESEAIAFAIALG